MTSAEPEDVETRGRISTENAQLGEHSGEQQVAASLKRDVRGLSLSTLADGIIISREVSTANSVSITRGVERVDCH